MELSLADFPSEILAEITFHLHGFHILRMLYLTGSGILWSKLQQCGVRHLTLSDALVAESDLQKISTFQGLLSLHATWCGMDPSRITSLLDVLPVTLTRLHLMDEGRHTSKDSTEAPLYRHQLFSGRNNPQPMNLSRLFPHLTDLNLQGVDLIRKRTPYTFWTSEMTISFLRMLPRGLKSLHMDNLSTCKISYVSYLPPHLTRLTRSLSGSEHFNCHLEPLPATLQDSLLDYTIQVPMYDTITGLPPHLTSLACCGQWDRLFQPLAPVLPSGLISLTFSHANMWADITFDDESTKYLPTTMKTLHFENQHSKCSDATQWPPKLTCLKLLTEDTFTHARHLPKSLQSLTLANVDAFDLSSLPESIRSLDLDFALKSDAEMQQLPRNLTSLAVKFASPKTPISTWPAGLTALKALPFPSWTVETARMLPNTLIRLDIFKLPDYIVQQLPLSLTHLQMHTVEITGRIPMNFDPQAPSNTAKIPISLFFDPLRFRAASSGYSSSQCDSSLRQPFNVKRCMLLNAHLTERELLIKTSVKLTALPPNITSLAFDTPFELNSTTEEEKIALFVHLKSLSGHFPFFRSTSDLTPLTRLEKLLLIENNYPSAFPSCLPPSLTDMEVQDSEGKWTRPLPITLRRLCLPLLDFAILKPLKQLETLRTHIWQLEDFLATPPTTVTSLSLEIIRNDEFLPIIDALPHLKMLESHNLEIFQVELEGLVARRRIIEIRGIKSLQINRPQVIPLKWGVKIIEAASLQQSMHQTILSYYPHLVNLEPNAIELSDPETIWPNIIVPALFPHLTVLNLRDIVVPYRFTHWLPRSITDLDIINVRGTAFRTTSGLPPSLTRLRICGEGFCLLSYQQLPRSITDLEICHQRKFWPKHAKNLPPSLRLLSLDVSLTSNDMIAELPRTITSLDFGKSARTITGPALRNLPPNLSFLGGSFRSVDDVTYAKIFSRVNSIDTYGRLCLKGEDYG